jgi:signal transduction histidine kinase
MTDIAKPQQNDLDPLGDMGLLAERLFIEGPFLLALIDPALRYVRVSQRLAETLGQEVTHFPGKAILKHGFNAKHKAVVQQALERDQTQVLKNWTVTAAGQETKMPGYWQWTIVPLHDPKGRVYGLLLSGRDVTDRRLLESEVIEAAARERREVSREIHDNIGQLLAAINMKAKVLELKLEDQQLLGAEEVRELRDLAAEMIGVNRRIAKQLYPVELETGGFLNALWNLAEDTKQLYGVSCHVMAPDHEPDMEPVQAVHIHAIVKSAIQHAVKQADAQDVAIEFSVEPERYVVTVTHDGKAYVHMGAIKGYRMMTFHAHTVGDRLLVEGRTGQPVVFTGTFPRMIGDDL